MECRPLIRPQRSAFGRSITPALVVVLLLSVATSTHAQVAAPTRSALDDITVRGRALAEYDFAAWHATDAVEALKPKDGTITSYIARPTPKGWAAVFGTLTANRDTFLVAYEAIRSAQTGPFEGFAAIAHPLAVADTGYYARAARGIDVARKDFGSVTRPYNSAVLPLPDGSWYVYLMPAQTVAGVFPLGADTRYLVSPDGRTIREKRRLHNSVIEFRQVRPPQPGATMEAGTHTAVLADIPEDTDVFHVLVRTPRIPEYIMTDHFVYRVETDGTIKFLGQH
ncbi:MAG: hypothetical protein ACREMS_11240 [Gemmatimonadaceae bacterium]